LIHADLCGPITPISNSNKRYLICFIDDFSRKIWVYFLDEKSEAFIIFKYFKSLVEKETGSCIKSLRIDRGREFTSQEFNQFCKENGIKRQLTAAYTPQQNGVAKRKNMTIMNMVRSMISNKKIPKSFWPEAVNWTVYVLNRSPTLAVKNMTPEEAWSGIKPSVEHFRVFGCVSHVHVPDVKRTKLEDKSFSCVLLGVSKESKAYRLYDPISKRIVVSRDVKFEEDKCWDWDKSYEELITVDLECGDNEGEVAISDNEGDNDAEEVEIVPSSAEEVEIIPSSNVNDIVPSSNMNDINSSSSNEGRSRRRPVWMDDYDNGDNFSEEDTANMVLFAFADPVHFEEAVKSERWKAAMDSEMKAIEKNNSWLLTDLPVGKKKIGVKLIYKTKLKESTRLDW